MSTSFPERILAIGAHPDDLEIQMGGTLAKYAKLGCHVVIAVATDGSAGHMLIQPDELAKIRRGEAEESASVIGAEFHWLGFTDELIADDINTRLRFTELIRQARPDIIFTHFPEDYHPDHRTVSKLVFDASFLSGLPNIKTASPAHPDVQPLYYFDTMAGVGFQPEEYVDITEMYETKCKMLSKHASQVNWLMDHDQMDIKETIRLESAYRGNQCGVKMAEGFRTEPAWPRLRTFRLLP